MNLEYFDFWNLVICCYYNVVDLVIMNLGKLECWFVLLEQEKIKLLLEVLEDRIGYFFVWLEESL